MLKIENVKVEGFEEAIRGMRNSWESWEKSDSYIDFCVPEHYGYGVWKMGPKDFDLAMRLSKAGASHAKYLRMIIVWADITAGMEWWKQFDTYKVGTVSSSTSLMHTLGKRLLTPEDFSFDDPEDPLVLTVLNTVNEAIKEWWESGKKVGSYEWRLLQKLIPMGILYRRTVTMNYEVLKHMYHDRKGHRLQEWRDFCAWVETLPYSQLIALKEE